MKKMFSIFVLSLFSLLTTAQNTEVRYLSGTDKDHAVTWDFFYTKGRNSEKWSTIQVPSHWEFQGFGNFNYGQNEKVFNDEKGLYKYQFPVAKNWKTKKIFLVFEGTMTDTEVKINGKSTDKSINKAERRGDFWVFGGIYRPVYLEANPSEFIDRVAIDAKADGSFKMDAFLSGIKKAKTIEAWIQTTDGKAFGSPISTPLTPNLDQKKLTGSFAQPSLWNPESPKLYDVVVSLKDGKKVLHQISQRFGFRTVEVKPGDGIFVNNQKIIFRGVCRHTAWPTSGRCSSKELSILDVNLMSTKPLAAGGFLWVFADEGILRKDLNDSIDTHGNNAPDGILGPYREKEGSFYTIKEIWSPVHINTGKLQPSFDGAIQVTNRFLYTNLNKCTFSAELVKFNGVFYRQNEQIQQLTVHAPSIMVGESGALKMNLPNSWKEFGVFSKIYNNTVTGETFDYPEFKGYYSNFYAVRIQTKELPFSIVSATGDLFLHLFTPQPAKFVKGGVSPSFPEGNISILNGISAIGTKFTKPEAEGPQSQPNEYLPTDKPLSGKIYFHFGP